MSIRAAWTAFFGDPAWFKRTALAAVIAFVPYVGSVAIMGFSMRHTRDVAWGRGQTLPEWREFDKHLKSGFFGFVAMLVYTVPLTLAFSVIFAAVIVAGIAAVAESGELALIVPLVLVFALLMLISTVLGGALWAVITHVALYDTISSGFEFKVIWARTRENLHDFGRAWGRSLLLNLASQAIVLAIFGVLLGGLAASLIASGSDEALAMGMLAFYPLEFLALFVGMFVSFPVGQMSANIWGQYARVAYALDRPA
ncbi:MAG: DUF4013 domain-containing protein [Coriobacteriia bacterium]